MRNRTKVQEIAAKYRVLAEGMDEGMRRRWAAAEAQAYGWGGLQAVSGAVGMSPNTIRKGLIELAARAENPDAPLGRRLRREGGGRKRCTEADPELIETLESLVEPTRCGDPMSALRWTCKSTGNLAEELTRQGHPVSPRTVGRLLGAEGYRLQGNRKTKEGDARPDRNAQFVHINWMVTRFQQCGEPVISVDTQKKELIGQFKSGGRKWQPKGRPGEVKVHDFVDKELGKVIPHGVYDWSENKGWVSVGIDHDTARFAAEAIRRWWKKMGTKRYRDARKLLITADGGGSNGSRCRLWRLALQELATKIGIPIHVCHFPPGIRKWNEIEHCRFCHITQNWRGRPLVSHEVIIQLIANTHTKTGLQIRSEPDSGCYPTGIKVSDDEPAALKIKRVQFYGDWNYALLPARKTI
ncbi:MAG TPA: ISAzo13 family transposase [Chromatiales bacterium]|nr:ISAzo13 family transposase [Chromatiales bacterium]